jgi:hypothetical protein
VPAWASLQSKEESFGGELECGRKDQTGEPIIFISAYISSQSKMMKSLLQPSVKATLVVAESPIFPFLIFFY